MSTMEVVEGAAAKEPEAIDGDEEIDELSASFALIEASLQDQVHWLYAYWDSYVKMFILYFSNISERFWILMLSLSVIHIYLSQI